MTSTFPVCYFQYDKIAAATLWLFLHLISPGRKSQKREHWLSLLPILIQIKPRTISYQTFLWAPKEDREKRYRGKQRRNLSWSMMVYGRLSCFLRSGTWTEAFRSCSLHALFIRYYSRCDNQDYSHRTDITSSHLSFVRTLKRSSLLRWSGSYRDDATFWELKDGSIHAHHGSRKFSLLK